MKTQAHQAARLDSSVHEDPGTSSSKTIFKCPWRPRHIKQQDYIQVSMKTQAHQGAWLDSSVHEDPGTSRGTTRFKCPWRPRHIKEYDYIQVHHLAAATAKGACIIYNQTTQDAVTSSTPAVALALSALGDVKKKHAGLVHLVICRPGHWVCKLPSARATWGTAHPPNSPLLKI